MKNRNVDEFLANAEQFRPELEKLREIMLEFDLKEEIKWNHPCYVAGKGNVAIIGAHKDYALLSFFKGSLLKDPLNLLVKSGPNTESGKDFRFTNVEEIAKIESVIKDYVHEAIEVEKAGLKVEYSKSTDLAIPKELQFQFDEMPDFEQAFYALTPGRQKGYILHFAGAKQSKTRTKRIEKYTQRIFDGKGIHDCVCGLSKRMPTCDGSHKVLDNK